jgi:FtsP/CotA-like multicopper oxidase with cupredoxin domain
MISKKQKVQAGALLLTPISAGIQDTYAVSGVLKKSSRVRAFQPTAIIGFIGSALMLVSAQAFAVDSDGDGVDDLADNCTQVANPLQRDTDEDGYGNYCDADFDQSLTSVDLTDFSMLRTAFSTAGPDEDLNGDGTVNLSDFSLFRGMFGSLPGPSCVDTADGCAEPLAGGTLDPLIIPKYVTPLVIPPVMNNNGTAGQYDIAVRQFQQQILPGGIWNTINGRSDAFPPTTIWSYGPAADALPDSTALGGAAGVAPAPNSQFNYPAYTMENLKDVNTAVNWINDLTTNAWDPLAATPGDALPHLFAIDQSLHWANPTAECKGGELRTDCMGISAEPYTGPVPIITHVHGAHVDASHDGYTEAWWLPNADNINCIPRDAGGVPATAGGFNESTNQWDVVCEGTIANQLTDRSGTVNVNTNVTPGVGNFVYQNDQPSATIWYHDHSLGMTRLNVMAGPAGFWLIREANGGETGLIAGNLPGPAPVRGEDLATTNLPASLGGERNKYREIPVVIQGRSFNADGSLFYPDNRAFFEGLNVEGTAGTAGAQFPGEPELQIDMDPLTSDIAPIWNPEAFFNTMVVNGVTWPKLEVAPAQYRFRLLNGTNARFLNLALKITDADGNPVSATKTYYVLNGNGTFDAATVSIDELDFYQIGAEQSLKPTVTAIRTAFATDLSTTNVGADGIVDDPTPQSSTDQALLMGVAERADVIVDFRGLPDGTIITMTNTAADSPFGGFPDTPADPFTTGQVMRFVVNSAHLGLSPTDELRDSNNVVLNPGTAASNVDDLVVDPAALGNFDVVVTNPIDRELALIEEESALICVDVDLDGNLVQVPGIIPEAGVCAVGEAFAPKAAVLGTVDVNNGAQVTLWSDPITTNINSDGSGANRAERWNLWNFTVDGHPIHVHLVAFKVLGRYAIGGEFGDGSSVVTTSAVGREAWEDGWKDTVITYPGEVTSIEADFDINGLYVWHCHIVEHEDNEMMVPMCVGVPGVDCPAQLF